MISYFAYGSNMLRQRLLARVGSVQELGTACLENHRLSFHKRGGDGSGKCTVMRSDEHDHAVWGVLFGLDHEQRKSLDGFEGAGYEAREVSLMQDGRCVRAFTYVATSHSIDTSGRPFPWYKALVISGAHQYRLPRGYISNIGSISTIPDPDLARAKEHYQLIAESGFGAILALHEQEVNSKT